MNTPNLLKLAAVIRELAEAPETRHAATYASMLADLARTHEAMAALDTFSPERRRLFGSTRAPWNAARLYALRHGFEHPTACLKQMGFAV